jgi:hypothetical protein
VEWLRFLKQLDRDTPRDLDLPLIIANYATHKHAEVKAWLARHARFHIHFTPTGSSWPNLVERFFADITQDAIRDGSFTSVRRRSASAGCHRAVGISKIAVVVRCAGQVIENIITEGFRICRRRAVRNCSGLRS